MNLWVWSRSVGFRFGFSLEDFCVSFFILSEFLNKDVLECVVNPNYVIRCCDCTLINLDLKTILLIFNTTHKIGCCEFSTDWDDIIYDTWNQDLLTIHFSDSSSRRYYMTHFLFIFLERYAPSTTFVLSFVYFLFLKLCFWYLHYVIFVFQ